MEEERQGCWEGPDVPRQGHKGTTLVLKTLRTNTTVMKCYHSLQHAIPHMCPAKWSWTTLWTGSESWWGKQEERGKILYSWYILEWSIRECCLLHSTISSWSGLTCWGERKTCSELKKKTRIVISEDVTKNRDTKSCGALWEVNI